MITIEIACTKCGFKSDSPYLFRRRYSFYDHNGDFHDDVHLCLDCCGKLYQAKMKTIAQFLGEEEVQEWREYEGVL